MKFSWIIPTIRLDFDNYIYNSINSIIDNATDCPFEYEIVVVAPFKIPKSFPHVRYVVEPEPTSGSVFAINLGAQHAKGEFLAMNSCDHLMQAGWWHIVECMERTGAKVSAFKTGIYAGIKFPDAACLHRSFYEGDLMKGHMVNPAFHHQYCSIDLGLMCRDVFIECSESWAASNDAVQHDELNYSQKLKYFRLDGMIFNRIWAGKVPPVGLFGEMDHTDEELEKMADERVKLSLW